MRLIIHTIFFLSVLVNVVDSTRLTDQKNACWGLEYMTSFTQLDPSKHTFSYSHDPDAGTAVDVYVFDSGIQIGTDESDREFRWKRASWGISCTALQDKTDHWGRGTRLSALVAGRTYGIAKNASVVAVQIFGKPGNFLLSLQSWEKGVDYVLLQHSRSRRSSIALIPIDSPLLNGLTAKLVEAGVHVVVAAESEGQDTQLNAGVTTEGVITVGSIDIRGERTSFGRATVYAPGVDISVPLLVQTYQNHVGRMAGTSVAAARIAGMIAYILSSDKHRKWTPQDMYRRVRAGRLVKFGSEVATLAYFHPNNPVERIIPEGSIMLPPKDLEEYLSGKQMHVKIDSNGNAKVISTPP